MSNPTYPVRQPFKTDDKERVDMDLENSFDLDRRKFIASAFAAGSVAMLSLAGCGSTENKGGAATADPDADKPADAPAANAGNATDNDPETITMVWYPNESAAEYDDGRAAFGKALEVAFDRPVELMTTTDYNVAIEAVTSGKAQMAYLGAEGYIQAEKKNPDIKAIFTTSDSNGTLDEAMYYSRIAVREEDSDEYRDGSGWTIDPIKGKSMSFVSPSSTSGFKVPSSYIVDHFGLDSSDVLTRGGEFFSEVLYGNSHQGSIVNLLAENCDVCAVDDIDIVAYLEEDVLEGEPNRPGAVYKVKEGAEAPFDRVIGKTFRIIQSTPVLNAPMCINAGELSDELIQQVTDHMVSDAVANDEAIFAPEGKSEGALWEKDGDNGFVAVTPEWYDPIRNM